MNSPRIPLSGIIVPCCLLSFSCPAAEDVLIGANPAWATATNWSLGAIPTIADNALIRATGTVDLRGSAFNTTTPPNYTEIQDLAFNSTAALTITNNSTSANITLGLNGGRGPAIPLIATTGNFAYGITGTGTGTHTLTLQLGVSGDIHVDQNVLTISASILESGGARDLSKSGAGRLILSGTNTLSGSVTVSGGILEVANVAALSTGPTTVNGGTLEINVAGATLPTSGITVNSGGQIALRNVVFNNPVTLNGGTLGTRTGDLSDFTGAITVLADSSVGLRSYTTTTNAQDLTISGALSGSSVLTITGNNPQLNGGNPTSKALILTNPGNTFSGTFHVTAGQNLRSAPLSTGTTLSTASVRLSGGGLQLRDDGTSNDGVLAYGNNVTVDTADSTIDVNNVALNTGNTIQLGALSIGSQRLTVSGGNGYSVKFNSATLNGSPTFNTTTASLTLGTPLTGDFTVTKQGAGTLTLTGANTYTGATVVQGGILKVLGTVPNTRNVDVRTGATLDVGGSGITIGPGQALSGGGMVLGNVTIGNTALVQAGDANASGTLTVNGLVLGTAAGQTSTLRVGGTGIPASVVVTNNNGLIANGGANSVTVDFVGEVPALGQYVLVDYSGTFGGTGFPAFKLGPLPPRMIASLVHNTANTSVDLNVTGVDFPVWSGALSSEWSTATLGNPKNWVLNSSSITPTDFLANDRVLFNDAATRMTIDISSGDVTPARVLFQNSTKNFTITGANGIAGAINFTKNGTGTLAVNNTNSFTGGVFLNAGTVQVPVLANAGINSPLGAGTTITFDGGTLEYTGAAAGSTDRPLVFNANGGSVKNTLDVTLSGQLSGAGTLTKVGSGRLILTNTGNTHGATTIAAGAVLQLGDGTALGSAGPGIVTTNGELVFNHSNAATFTNEVIGSGKVTKLGTGTLTLGGTAMNGYTGVTTVTQGTLIAGKTAGTAAIPGDLVIEAGGTFQLGADEQIADTSSVTINGGTFGTPAVATPANPGPIDTIANLTLNGGTFGSNRSTTGFTITNALKVNTGGTAVVQRGGILRANAVNVSGGTVNLDGGSTTAGQESKLEVGSTGIQLDSGTINFNTGPSAITATSQGSIVLLNGDLTSTGTSSLVRQNAATAGPKAIIDLGGSDRTFNVTGRLGLGTIAAPIGLSNGGLVKTGTGTLELPDASNSFTGTTNVHAGTLLVTGSMNASTVTVGNSANLSAPATLMGRGTVGTLNLGAAAGNVGARVNPGDALSRTGILNSGSFTQSAGSKVVIEIGGLVAGLGSNGDGTNGYDRLNVTGDITLAGQLEAALLNGFDPQDNVDAFFIIVNNGGGLTTGKFTNTVQDFINFSGQAFVLNYTADFELNDPRATTGNDVALIAIPEPGGAVALLTPAVALGLRRRRTKK